MVIKERNENDFILVSSGDSLIFQRLSIFNEPGFLDVRRIVKDSDAAFKTEFQGVKRIQPLG